MRASPPGLREYVAAWLALFFCGPVCSLAQPLLVGVDSTPYDHQMMRIQPVLAWQPTEVPGSISLSLVNQSMTRLRRLRYRYSNQWQTPEEVGAARCGDCKGKAIALYQFMQSIGAANVRFVIGKHHAGDWFTHAWLEWETANGELVLDPTFNRNVIRAEKLDSSKYIPLYVFEGTQRYRAVNGAVAEERPLPAVASGRADQFNVSFATDCRLH
jgi:hypothetical protein